MNRRRTVALHWSRLALGRTVVIFHVQGSEVCKQLMREAVYERNCMDNCSLMLILLNPIRKEPAPA